MLQDKLGQLRLLVEEMGTVLVAYSGGVDSALVAKIAWDTLGNRALAVTAASPSLAPEDLAEARAQAQFIGIPHQVIQTQEVANPSYARNPTNRCYFCKSELYGTLVPLAQSLGYAHILDGLNQDDLGDYRPGIQAAKEKGARSPLAEVGLSKWEVRQLSQSLGLPWWDKPAQPCLSSRFPYGEPITPEKLHQVARAELHLRSLGYQSLRVRSQAGTARIELPTHQIREFVASTDLEALVQTLQGFGFTYVTLDLEGFRSGKLNRTLTLDAAAH